MKKLFAFVFILLFGISLVYSVENDRPLSIGGYLIFLDREGQELYQPKYYEEEEEVPSQILNFNVRIEKKPYYFFRNNWSGLEIGYNEWFRIILFGYSDNFRLNPNKSVVVNLNFLQKNLFFINQNIGVYTGLGFTWNNYRFDHNYLLTKENNKVTFVYEDVNFNKNKLLVKYLRVPLIVEFQTFSPHKIGQFHIGAGIIGSMRTGSHTKQMVKTDDGRDKWKTKDDFYLSRFKVEPTFKIGWGRVNLFATYSVTPLFRDKKGPNIYPLEFGIRILDL